MLHNCIFSKHGQVKGFFNKEFIKSGVFPNEFGKLFNAVFEYRQKLDYVDFVVPDKDMISDYLTKPAHFIRKIQKYLEDQKC